jgi:hypothetical protein
MLDGIGVLRDHPGTTANSNRIARSGTRWRETNRAEASRARRD